jgi:hypothetical protein
VGRRERLEVIDPDDGTPKHGLPAAFAIPVLRERGNLEFSGLGGEVGNLLGEYVGTEDDERLPQETDQPTRSSA